MRCRVYGSWRATGGEAFLATLDGVTVGAAAVKGLGASGFEFCKLVVTEASRGHGAPPPGMTVLARTEVIMSKPT